MPEDITWEPEPTLHTPDFDQDEIYLGFDKNGKWYWALSEPQGPFESRQHARSDAFFKCL